MFDWNWPDFLVAVGGSVLSYLAGHRHGSQDK